MELNFSALIGVDPVAGVSRAQQLEPKVLTFEPDCLAVGMPVLVPSTSADFPAPRRA
jgi:chlorophyllase